MYCAVADLEKLVAPGQLRQLADDGPGAPAPEEVMAEAIDQADREIDAYLGTVREVPLDPVPPLVANLSAKIAVYNLHRRRTHLDLGEWAEEYKRALRLLERIAAGDVSLGPPEEGGTSQPAGGGQAVVVTGEPMFTDQDLERY